MLPPTVNNGIDEALRDGVQAHDFEHLFRTEECELQLGGSDQWGNITAGIELIGRRNGTPAHGLVLPLLTTSSGAKFGKSEGGNVWLDPAKTSPYKFYQFWLNTEDLDLERLLKMFTFEPLERIAELLHAHAADPGKRRAHRVLAQAMTDRIHGEPVTKRVMAASEVLFGGGDLRSADPETLAVVAGEVATIVVPAARLGSGLSLIDALVESGLASSKADAKRGIQGQGFSINGEKVGAADRVLTLADVIAGRFIALQKGRRNFALIRID